MNHTFFFNTPASDNVTQILKNIIHIEKKENKYFVQYIQYREMHTQESETTIELSQKNIQVDRDYFLEIANICIDNRERRRQLFSIIGKRRFKANNKKYGFFLTSNKVTKETLKAEYKTINENIPFDLCYSESNAYSTNQYRVIIHKMDGDNFAFLDQINVTKRKKSQKVFCVEISESELNLLESIKNQKRRVNYIFNKIGKIYFKSLKKKTYTLQKNHENSQDLALAQFVDNFHDTQSKPQTNSNIIFKKLQKQREKLQRVDISLHTNCIFFVNNPHDIKAKNAVQKSLQKFVQHIQTIEQLNEIATYFATIQELIETGTLVYLLAKHDNDLKDTLLYMLEIFIVWNEFLYAKHEDIPGFNASTIDLITSLEHLINMCYTFQNEYKSLDIKNHETTLYKLDTAIDLQLEKVTSAQEFFHDFTIEKESCDELKELETEVEQLFYSDKYSDTMNKKIILFFEGYARVLNFLLEFKELAYSLLLLTQKLSKYKVDENKEMLVILMRALLTDIIAWKKAVLVTKTAEDIHYMDKSFYSNIAQIEILLEQQKTPENDHFIEFF